MPKTSLPIHPKGWYGCNRDVRDPRDYTFRPGVVHLPRKVDLRADCPPVMDQGNLGSCTANGITGALRYLVRKAGQTDATLARLQLYYDERVVEGTVKEDAGAEIRDGIKCAAKIGVAHETKWPYIIKNFTKKPTAAVYNDAIQFRALTYERCAVTTTALKSALALGFPVVIGFTVFESFESAEVEKTGMVPMPNLKTEQILGGHCVYVVGYGQHAGTFTVRNSWASDWGDKGDCYFPEAYLGSTKYGSDYWVIKSEGKA